MERSYLSGRAGYTLIVLLFISAGLNGCLGGADEMNRDSQKVPIVLALDSNLGNAEGIIDDSLLSTFEVSSEFSISTYPVDSEAAKIEALRFGHIDVALVDGATAWMGWKEYGLEGAGRRGRSAGQNSSQRPCVGSVDRSNHNRSSGWGSKHRSFRAIRGEEALLYRMARFSRGAAADGFLAWPFWDMPMSWETQMMSTRSHSQFRASSMRTQSYPNQ